MKSLFRKKWLRITLVITAILLLGWVWFYNRVNLQPPDIADQSPLQRERIRAGTDFYTCGNSWLKKNKSGLWELFVEGKPFERGVTIGKLAPELIQKQEDAFVDQIYQLVPSKIYLRFLKYFIAWFNRNLNEEVPNEFREEIYGISFAFSHDYDYIGTPYQRILNYHAAHDIGHALQDKRMVVGCTSFSAWGNQTDDHELIIGRNFDFYAGDRFAEDKIVCFYQPDKGYRFMIVTWAGMTGAVSGMNEKGLTVTLNAAKSKIPSSAATPVSLVAREVLQYASDIREARAIIQKRKTFVSETFMIGSAADGKTVLIEKTPYQTDQFVSDRDYIICSNHYQGDSLKDDALNLSFIRRSTTAYRYRRMDELIRKNSPVSVKMAAEILRNQKGLHNKELGMGNEKAINQLLAHHSVIFKPLERKVWVSANPYQLGEYVCYDLKLVFNGNPGLHQKGSVSSQQLDIPPDKFLTSPRYISFVQYREMKNLIKRGIEEAGRVRFTDAYMDTFIRTNPDYYDTYRLAGDYYRTIKNYTKAIELYSNALTREIATMDEQEEIQKKIEELKTKQGLLKK